jgi:hypothetical protein
MGSINPTQMFLVILVFFIGYSIFQTWSLKDKVYCTFRRKDKVLISKVVKLKQGRVSFENGWYDLDSGRTTLRLVWQGIIPTWVRCLDFRCNSRYALDPDDFKNDADNPNDRAALDMTDDLRALFETQKTSLSKGSGKKSLLEGLMPILTIGGFIILGYLVYQQGAKMDMLGTQGNVTQQQIVDLMRALGK